VSAGAALAALVGLLGNGSAVTGNIGLNESGNRVGIVSGDHKFSNKSYAMALPQHIFMHKPSKQKSCGCATMVLYSNFYFWVLHDGFKIGQSLFNEVNLGNYDNRKFNGGRNIRRTSGGIESGNSIIVPLDQKDNLNTSDYRQSTRKYCEPKGIVGNPFVGFVLGAILAACWCTGCVMVWGRKKC
jgi:hypothetical protein